MFFSVPDEVEWFELVLDPSSVNEPKAVAYKTHDSETVFMIVFMKTREV